MAGGQLEAAEITVATHARKKTGRRPIPQEFPRVEVVHDIPEADKVCACGCQHTRIGEECSEKLDFIPAQIQVVRHILPKYACLTHVRREFVDVVKAGSKKSTGGTAQNVVDFIGKLYHLEKQARDTKLDADRVRDMRQEKAKPIMVNSEAPPVNIFPAGTCSLIFRFQRPNRGSCALPQAVAVRATPGTWPRSRPSRACRACLGSSVT